MGVHYSQYKRPNDTLQPTNVSETKKIQWSFPCELVFVKMLLDNVNVVCL